MPMSRAGEVALEYCMAHTDMSSRCLGRLLYVEHPKQFSSEQVARDFVRLYRGKRKFGGGKGVGVAAENIVPTTYDGKSQPPTASVEWAPVYVPATCTSTLILADMHVPYHDEKAINCAVKHARDNHDIDSLILLGDTHDVYHLSRWEKDPEARRFAEEIDNVKQMLDYLRSAFKFKWSAFKCGNHEQRFETYLRGKAPELIGTREFQLKVLYGLHERKMEWVDNIIPMKIGYLWLVHGHELGKGITSPVNPARGAFLRANDIVVEGHYHRSSHHSDTTLSDKTISCWSIGCLCDLHPPYVPVNKWNHGYAVVDRKDAEGNFELHNYKIINRKQVVSA